jgi:dipeptidyl aminopeptidase/acylaminoacyl peptidase
MKAPRPIIVTIILISTALACANPTAGNAPANVETIVAGTLTALTAPAPGNTPAPSTYGLLPHSMYFLNNDNKGLIQVYRLEKDGKTIKQITFEPAKVDFYDVSLIDGSVAYVTNNQIFTVNADGSNRSMIVDGGPVDPNDRNAKYINGSLWSPDGQTIAYGYQGINIYSIAAGQSTLLLENHVKTENGFHTGEFFAPVSYSPDGSKLLISIVVLASDGQTLGFFNLGNKSMVPVIQTNHSICCSLQWTGDNNTLYGGFDSFNPFESPGLWRVNATRGVVTDLISSLAGNENVLNFASHPFLAADGQLYYFYATQPYTQQDEVSRAPLQLVRSATDGVTGRTILIPDIFNTLNEALWAPDASFVVTASGPIQDVNQGGITELYYTDGKRAMTSLLPYAFNLKWGP